MQVVRAMVAVRKLTKIIDQEDEKKNLTRSIWRRGRRTSKTLGDELPKGEAYALKGRRPPSSTTPKRTSYSFYMSLCSGLANTKEKGQYVNNSIKIQ